jgi:tetratricopeptide (TPR) repeat protein
MIGTNPGYAEFYLGRGNTYYALGQRERALEDYTHGIKLNPDHIRTFYQNRGMARQKLGDEKGAQLDFKLAGKKGQLRPGWN